MTLEKDLHLRCATHIRYAYPEAIFVSDFAAGLKLPPYLAKRQKALRSGRAYPDIFIAEPRGEYHGCYFELKKHGTHIFTRDGRVRASKNNWLQEQYDVLEQLRERGYYATFVPGLDFFLQYLTWYMGGAAVPMKPYGPQHEWGEKLLNKSSSTEVEDHLPF